MRRFTFCFCLRGPTISSTKADRHVDLMAWMFHFGTILQKLADATGQTKTAAHYERLCTSLKKHVIPVHWSGQESSGSFQDYGTFAYVDSNRRRVTFQEHHVSHMGYVNLLGFVGFLLIV